MGGLRPGHGLFGVSYGASGWLEKRDDAGEALSEAVVNVPGGSLAFLEDPGFVFASGEFDDHADG